MNGLMKVENQTEAPRSEGIQVEEKKNLESIQEKLRESFNGLDENVSGYEKEYKESMKYLWENRSGMDKMEIFSNEKAVSQIVDAGELTVRRKKIIEKLMDSPYFARINFKYEGERISEPFYIGRFSFGDKDGDMLIYDWRAPISSMYYDFELGEAFYTAPMGKIKGQMTLKRQYKIKNGKLEYALESSISINDEVLQKEVSHTSDQRMKNIVSTIQKEQNQIIRNEKAEVLVIQGVAGSGKTSIALHRIAYFLYKYKDRIRADNMMILSPNKVFSDYISNVLPELGEEPITQTGFDEIAEELLGDTQRFERSAKQMERVLDGKDDGLAERVKFKSSMEFLMLFERYLEKTKRTSEIKPEEILKIYQEFFIQMERPELFIKRNDVELEASDVYPYLYLKLHLEGFQGFREVKHVVIDEMQDYTPTQFAVIRKLFHCKKTILGDFGQSLNPHNKVSKEIFKEIYETAELVELTRSYRCSYEIIKFAQKIQNQKIDPVERHGDEPEILYCKDKRAEILQISTLLKGIEARKAQTVGVICKTMEQARSLHKELEKLHQVFLLSSDSSVFQNGITITSVHMAKGLEFDEVILPSVNAGLYCSEHDRTLLYVACTRAMHRLTISYYGEASTLLPDR